MRQAGGGVAQRFQLLKKCRRIWAVSPIHGDADRLVRVHNAIDTYFDIGDRIVYLGIGQAIGSVILLLIGC